MTSRPRATQKMMLAPSPAVSLARVAPRATYPIPAAAKRYPPEKTRNRCWKLATSAAVVDRPPASSDSRGQKSAKLAPIPQNNVLSNSQPTGLKNFLNLLLLWAHSNGALDNPIEKKVSGLVSNAHV